MRKRSLVAALSLVALLGFACGDDDDGDAGGNGAGGDTVTLTAAGFAFDPGSVSAAAGGSIELVNEDDAKHNLTAEDAALDVDVEPGATATVDLGNVEPGSYDFFCEYHPDAMTGTLEVTG